MTRGWAYGGIELLYAHLFGVLGLQECVVWLRRNEVKDGTWTV